MPDSMQIASHALTVEIAEIVAQSNLSSVKADSIKCAKHAILDWMGVTYAGLSEPLSIKLRDSLAVGGPCSVIGTDLTASAHDAALINGATSHALDYDDVNIMGHPTAPILPAVLAVGEANNASGEDVLLAFIAGYEAATLIAEQAMPSHYLRGFHSTGTLGTFGAAAGAARLLGLDTETTAHALGLAGTQAAGLKSMFGTMAKPFHAGKAAANGVLAATLAASGFEARTDVLEAKQGFFETQTDATADPMKPYDFGSHIRNNLFKYHAACYLTHSMMEGMKRLVTENALNSDTIESVSLHVPEAHLGVCNIQEPASGLETKFSLRHCAAFVSGGYDTAAIATYTDMNATNPNLVEFRQKVSVFGDLTPGTHAEIAVKTTTGDLLETSFDVGVPAADLDRQEAALIEKFTSLTNGIEGTGTNEFAQSVLNLSAAGSVSEFVKGLPKAV